MSVLYIILGISMFAGIRTILVIGSNINNQTNHSVQQVDRYLDSEYQLNDIYFLQLIQELSRNDHPSIFTNEICHTTSTLALERKSLIYKTELGVSSNNQRFKNSCTLTSKEGNHRIIIQPYKNQQSKNDNTIGYYSCLLGKDIKNKYIDSYYGIECYLEQLDKS